MKHTAIATILGVALGTVAVVGTAHARNPHCAGGIQYVVQGMRDKDKGNLEDYQRQMNKAVQQLEACASEDANDFEAVGYLGWAYAEIDSARQAGEAFKKAIDGLAGKDPKKRDWIQNNRDSYWATAFNSGITKINEAQSAYPNFLKAPDNDADKTLREEAHKKYLEAAVSLTRASQLKSGDPRTLRNLGSVYAFMGEWEPAQAFFEAGLRAAPGDTDLVKSLIAARQARAGILIDEKKYDEAIAFYQDLVKSDPSNSDLYLGIAEAFFKKAQAKEGDARKGDFKMSADAYSKAGELKPGNADLPFNAALAYQNAGEQALAAEQWKATLQARPEDTDAMTAYASTLAELKKFDEAITMLVHAIGTDPKNKNFHRQLGAVYTKGGNSAKGTEEFMVYLALHNGKPAADPAAQVKQAPAASAAAKLSASEGVPDQVTQWDADGQKYETWFYWQKKAAYHFNPDGVQLQKSDWSSAAPAAGKR